MNKYGKAAVRAVKMYREKRVASPQEAWEKATVELFGSGTPSQIKSCPKDAFLGLCQDGRIEGIPRGEYTRSKKNKDYAITAVELLDKRPELASAVGRL
jgi:hypothetical protein